MSYLRMGWAHTFVDGFSEDYIFGTGDGKGKGYIEDYGGLSNEGLIEILCERWATNDKELKEYIIKKLAQKLNVKMRTIPLTVEQCIKMTEDNIKLRGQK